VGLKVLMIGAYPLEPGMVHGGIESVTSALVPALAAHGIPAIITGFSLPDANIHSPNERMLVEYIDLGIVASKALLTEFAAL